VRVENESVKDQSFSTDTEKMTRECQVCKETKSLDDFYVSTKSACKSCHSRRMLVILAPRQASGKERLLKAILDRGECMDCKRQVTEATRALFHWDHRNPADKTANVSAMLGSSDETFYREISKCDLVCVICHAERTSKQRREGTIKKGRPRKYEK